MNIKYDTKILEFHKKKLELHKIIFVLDSASIEKSFKQFSITLPLIEIIQKFTRVRWRNA